MGDRTDAPSGSGRRRRSPVGAVARFGRRLLVGVLVGGGTIFGAKAEREQHWSIPPTMLVEQHAEDADGEPDDRGGETDRLPACA